MSFITMITWITLVKFTGDKTKRHEHEKKTYRKKGRAENTVWESSECILYGYLAVKE